MIAIVITVANEVMVSAVSVREQDYAQVTGWILMKLGRNVHQVPMKNSLNFGADPSHV